MLVAQLLPIFLSLVVTRPRPCLSALNQTGSDLLLANDLSINDEIFLSVSHIFRHQRKLSTVQPHIIQLLLLLSGTVEMNPGPTRRAPKFPCGQCKRAATNASRSIACDNCLQWFHIDCTGTSSTIFECYVTDVELPWLCTGCGIQSTSVGAFDTSISSLSSNETPIKKKPDRKKANKLRVFICNFQSIYNKQELLATKLFSHNIDLVIGTESHLSCNILDSEILPETGLVSF